MDTIKRLAKLDSASLFCIDTEQVKLNTERWMLASLGDSERLRFDQLSTKRKQTFLCGRQLIRHLQEFLPESSAPLSIQERPGLPPLVAELVKHGICFSISHSGRLVALAVTRSNDGVSIGLDIEKIRPNTDLAKADFFCHPEQARQLHLSPNPDVDFYRLWTQKEAYLKSAQQSIFNSKLKCLSFTASNIDKNTLQRTDTISGVINRDENNNHERYQVSIHTTVPTEYSNIITELVPADGKLTPYRKINIAWQPFYSADND